MNTSNDMHDKERQKRERSKHCHGLKSAHFTKQKPKALEISAAITRVIKNSWLSLKIAIYFLMLTCFPAGYFV